MSKDKRRVPKLRFPGFTEDWEQRKLGDCMNSFAYGLNAAAKDYDGMHKYIRITDIDDETHNFIQSNLTSPDIDFNMDVSDYKLNVGDIVFARTGASVGKTYLYNPNDGDLYYAGFLIRGTVKEDCDAGFIYQNTLTKEYDSFIRITSQRSGQPGVNSKEYATFRLNIPCKDEQKKISKVLHSLDELFTLHQRKLEHLNLKKKALLQKLFPKNGECYPELRFPGFTDAWEQRKLADIAKTFIGLVTTMTENYRDSGTLLIRNSDIKEGQFIFSEKPIHLDEEFAEKNKTRRLQIGDVVTVHTGDIGTSAVIQEKEAGAIGFATINTRTDKRILNPYFLSTYFNTEKHKCYANSVSTGDGRSNYNIKDFNKLVISIPTLDEQEKISVLINNINTIITLHQRKLDHLQLQKKALLQQMFV